MRLVIGLILLVVGFWTWTPAAQDVSLPVLPDSLKIAVLGDHGTGETPQYEVAAQMAAARAKFPFEMVLMLGDNMYGRQESRDFVTKFERPYAPLLQAGVRFYASLGNHDKQENRFYEAWNMNGARYYTYVRSNVRFIVLDTNVLDRPQFEWFEGTLKGAREPWRICYFHHPLYSNGDRHGSQVDLRVLLEPLLVEYGIDVVLSGHDHAYERLQPQKGIHYFVAGSGGQLRRGGVTPSSTTAAAFDQDRSFMLIEIARDQLFLQAISRTGASVDRGVIPRRPKTPPAGGTS